MNPKRLKNIAFIFLAMACFVIYGAAKTRPIQTSKLFVALAMAATGYGLMDRANRKESRK